MIVTNTKRSTPVHILNIMHTAMLFGKSDRDIISLSQKCPCQYQSFSSLASAKDYTGSSMANNNNIIHPLTVIADTIFRSAVSAKA